MCIRDRGLYRALILEPKHVCDVAAVSYTHLDVYKRQELSRKVAIARESHQQAPEPDRSATSNAMAIGMRMASEFVSAILVGALLGFGFDHWLKSTPIGLIIGLGIGFAAGVVNLVRAARSMTPSVSSAVACLLYTSRCV